MKTPCLAFVFAATTLLAGCATDSELSQKEKDRMAREQQREQQKQAQQQEKMLRGSGTNQNRMGTGMRSR
jgi:hypothetical protein